jgi:peroxiredoxin
MDRTRLRWITLIGVVAIVGGAWIYFTRVPGDTTNAASAAMAAARVGFRAPGFALPTLNGAQVALDDLRGKVVLVNFWATWCIPCRAEMPEIQAAYQAHRDQEFIVLAINVAEDDNTVMQFVEEFHLTFPILLDRVGAVVRQYQVQALPTTLFIDRAGVIRAANVGAMNRAYIEAQLTALLEVAR